MAKSKLTDWDTTAANNTDVGGINIAEGMLPSSVNNAMREMMAQVAKALAGTDAVPDTLSFGDPGTPTKRMRIDAGSVTAGVTRVLSMADRNVDLGSILAGNITDNITQGAPGGDCDAFVGTGFFRSVAGDSHRPSDAGTANMLVFQGQTSTDRNFQIGARVSGNATTTDFWVRNQGDNGWSNWIRIGAGLTYLGTVQYTSSGTFSKASYPVATHIFVEQQAPGGGGGGCSGSGSGVAQSGGGGGGEFAAGWFAVADLDASETVTIGAAGTGGSGNNAGNNGGDSSFKGMVSRGGRGGAGMAGGQTGTTAAFGGFDTSDGAWGSTVLAFGRVRIPGAAGGNGRVSNGDLTSLAEHGGGSYRGVGGRASSATGFANAGRGYGGGGGGVRNVTSGNVSGGNGAPGITVIHLFHGEPR